MKYLLFLLIPFSLKSQNLNTVLTNGNSTTLAINQTASFGSSYGIRSGSFQLQPVALNNVLLADNLIFDVPSLQSKYVSTGYGGYFQLYNGGAYISTSPSGTAGNNATVNYRFVGDNAGNQYLGTSMQYVSAWKAFTIGMLSDKSIHIAIPATGGPQDKALLLHASDSTVLMQNLWEVRGLWSGQAGLDADFTITNTNNYVDLGSTITANRTATIPNGSGGQHFWLYDRNTSAFHWNLAGTAVKSMSGSTITSLTNGHTYLLLWNTSNWIAVLQ